jgi:putative transposase
VLPLAAQDYPTLQKVWVDGAYEGLQVQAVAMDNGIDVEVVKRSDQVKGFVVQAKRWIGERTFGWLNRDRRLSEDYECTETSPESSAASTPLAANTRPSRSQVLAENQRASESRSASSVIAGSA